MPPQFWAYRWKIQEIEPLKSTGSCAGSKFVGPFGRWFNPSHLKLHGQSHWRNKLPGTAHPESMTCIWLPQFRRMTHLSDCFRQSKDGGIPLTTIWRYQRKCITRWVWVEIISWLFFAITGPHPAGCPRRYTGIHNMHPVDIPKCRTWWSRWLVKGA